MWALKDGANSASRDWGCWHRGGTHQGRACGECAALGMALPGSCAEQWLLYLAVLQSPGKLFTNLDSWDPPQGSH